MDKEPSLDVDTLPAERHCAVFDTALGPFGIAWRGEAVTHVLLPMVDREATVAELQWQSGAELAPPPWPAFISLAVRAMQALLQGEPADLTQVPLDWAGIGQFERKVYEATRSVAPGQTCTYDELAQSMNNPGAARAVDVALARNPWPLIVPCHRVVAGGGRLGGHSAAGGIGTKKKLLAIEAAMASGVASPGREREAR
jgi:methylated-DNA-[protein]-cysteine S-methyltransferase